MLWLTGGALTVCLVMVVGLLVMVLIMGLATFWPAPVEMITTLDGQVYMGEESRRERYRPGEAMLASLAPGAAERARAERGAHDGRLRRRLIRTGNYELTNRHFRWLSDHEIVEAAFPEWALVLERVEWGRFYAFPARFLIDGEPVAEQPAEVWGKYQRYHEGVRARWNQRRKLEKKDLGRTFRAREKARLAVRQAELSHDVPPGWAQARREVFELEPAVAAGREDQDLLSDARRRLERIERFGRGPDEPARQAFQAALDTYAQAVLDTERENQRIIREIQQLNGENARFGMTLRTARGEEKTLPLDQIVRAYPANRIALTEKLGIYFSRWMEFLTDEPREANSEGGVYPAIIGTVLMTLIMALLVVPFGVLAALYLREYAKAGPVISAVRIAINNLAGVPSIVFGVFGLGFFCYGVGGFIDRGPAWTMPRPIWFLALAALAVLAALGFLATLKGLARPGQPRTPGRRAMRSVAGALWLLATVTALVLIATTPFFDGLYRAQLPNPTFGKGALIWASFTLALLTLPVVIVATEEALAAVPNSMREGSYACGAGKWQTIRRIVLPRAMPGVMTGTILAMARGAGEVAPLMLVGAVKLAPELPVSWKPGEHFGLDRSFMHLGFHIYDLGFQSQNSEAAKPLVFTTTLLLIALIATLNLAAVLLRSRLRRKFVGAQF